MTRDRDKHAARFRRRMVAEVRAHIPITERIAAAMETVPRHHFLPGIPLERAYAEEAVVVKRDAFQQPISSASQPAMVALMLDQLDPRSGMRVLEIGAGTGYSAALLAELVGPAGHVTTVDLDPELVASASDHLLAAGYGPERVTVVQGDGALGWEPGAPYDRIILAIGAWDIFPAWRAQLAADGRLVLPLAIRMVQLSLALEPEGDRFTVLSQIPCGFMRLRGPFAGPEVWMDLDGMQLLVEPPVPPLEAVADLLAAPARMVPSSVQRRDTAPYTLAFLEPRTTLFTQLNSTSLILATGILTADATSACRLAADEAHQHTYLVQGTDAALTLMERALQLWQAAGEPSLLHWHLAIRPVAFPPPSSLVASVPKYYWTIDLVDWSQSGSQSGSQPGGQSAPPPV